MFPVHVESRDEREGDEEHQCVGGEIEAGLDDGVVLEGGALRVWWWHGPVAIEWSTGCEEGDFRGDPAEGDVDGEVLDEVLVRVVKSESGVHDDETGFDGVDDIEHCLVAGCVRERLPLPDVFILAYLFRQNHDLGSLDALLDILRCKGIKILRWIEITSSSSSNDIQTYNENCVPSLFPNRIVSPRIRLVFVQPQPRPQTQELQNLLPL